MAFNPATRERLRGAFGRLVALGHIKKIDPDNNDLPIASLYSDQVPVRDVHFALGRTVSSKKIDKEFARRGFFSRLRDFVPSL